MSRRVTTVALEANVSGVVRGFRTAGTEADAANRKVSSLERELQKLAAGRYDPSVVLQDRDAADRLRILQGRLEELAQKTTDARVGLDDAEAQSKLSRVEASLLALGHKTADPNIDLRGVAEAEASMGALEAQLARFDHQDYVAQVRVDGTARASRQASFLVDTITMLGPAAVTSAGVAGGAVLGLAAAFSTAVGPAGLLALTVGAQVKQMKAAEKQIQTDQQKLAGLTKGTADYQAQLQKVKAEQAQFNAQFGPAAAAVDRLKLAWKGYLTETGQGGVNQLIADASRLATQFLPQMAGIVEAAAGSTSKLLNDLAAFGRSPDAKALIAFLETRGPAAIEAFGAVAGNLGKGLLSLFMAFAPLQGDILGGLQRITAEFARWAAQVGQTQGFQAFMDYVRTEGPKVWDTLGSIAQALLAIAEAAAPVGAVTVPIIKSLADILTLIAKSPAGPVLVGLAVALTTLNRALTTAEAVKASALGKTVQQIGKNSATAAEGVTTITKRAVVARGALLGMGIGAEVLASHLDDSQSSLKDFLSVAGGAAAGFAIGGPWGAAVGAAGGLLSILAGNSQEAAAQQQALASNAEEVAGALNQQTGAITRNTTATLQKKLADQGAFDAASRLGISYGEFTAAAEGNVGAQNRVRVAIQSVLGPLEQQGVQFRDISAGVHAATPEYDRWKSSMDSAKAAASLLSGIMGAQSSAFADSKRHIEEQNRAIAEAELVLHPYRASLAQTNKVLAQLGPGVESYGAAAQASAPHVQSAAMSTEELAKAAEHAYNRVLMLDNQALGKVGNLINYKQTILSVTQALKQSGRGGLGDTTQGLANQQLLVSEAQAALARSADFKQGSAAQLAFLRTSRAELLKEATAFTGSKKAAQAFIDTIFKIPRKTPAEIILEKEAAQKAVDEFDAYTRKHIGEPYLATLDANAKPAQTAVDMFSMGARQDLLDVQHTIPVLGVDKAQALRDMDQFTGHARQDLDDVGNYVPDVKVDTQQALRDMNQFSADARRALDQIPDEAVNVNLDARSSKVLAQLGGVKAFATGGSVYGPGGPRDDKIPALLSNGERVTRTEVIDRAGGGDNRRGQQVFAAVERMILRGEFAKAGDLQRYADGGAVNVNLQPRQMNLGRAVSGIEGLFSRLIGSISDGVSKKVNDFLTHIPRGGQLGPGGRLTPSQVVRGQDFAMSQVGKPYIWGGVGPGGYDCSGFQSAVLNSSMGMYPYSRRGSTATMPWPGSAPGVGVYTIGWTDNYGGSGIGHTSGNIGGLNVESYGGHGPAVGAAARSPMDPHFWGHMHYDGGGVANGRGYMPKNIIEPERVLSPQQTQSFDRLVNVISHPMTGGVDRALVEAINEVGRRVERVESALHGELAVHDRKTAGALPHSIRSTAQDAVDQSSSYAFDMVSADS